MLPVVRSFMVAATRPGAGKTLIAAALVQALLRRGLHAVAMKPACTGTVGSDGVWRSAELTLLAAANAFPIPASALCPLRLIQAPLLPVDAAAAGQLDDVVDTFNVLSTWADAVIVEDAADLGQRARPAFDGPDVAAELHLPIVLVIALEEGADTEAVRLTRALASRRIKVAGWIANRPVPGAPDGQAVMERLRRRMPQPCLGSVPWLGEPEPGRAARSIELDGVLLALGSRP